MPNGRTDMFFPTIAEIGQIFGQLPDDAVVAVRFDRTGALTVEQIKSVLSREPMDKRVMIEQQHGIQYMIHVGDDWKQWPWFEPSSPMHELIRGLRERY